MDTQEKLESGLVSIMMPVLNGELFIEQALASLLAQDYSNFELIILDNQSTDRTAAICKAHAEKDRRIRYILDSKNRISHDAANHLATFVRGEYCMLACDDDLWEPNYLSRLVACLRENPEVGLVYSNAVYVDVEGRLGTRMLLRGADIRQSGQSRFSNFYRYARSRCVVPMVFGIYRTPVMRQALPFDTFDETIADVDNLFMLKVMSIARIHCNNEILFYYRNKFREAEIILRTNYPKARSAFRIWLYDARHQRLFTKKALELIDGTPFASGQKLILRLRMLQSLVLFMTLVRLRGWVGRLLVRHGLRHGPPQKPDIASDIRKDALLSARDGKQK